MALTWNEAEARIERARKALETGQYTIEPAASPSAKAAFAVYNGENANGDPYTVTFDEAHPTGTCTCPDFRERGGPACKHTAMVVLGQWPQQFDRWQKKVRDQSLAQTIEQALAAVETQAQCRATIAELHQLADRLDAEITAMQEKLAAEVQRLLTLAQPGDRQ